MNKYNLQIILSLLFSFTLYADDRGKIDKGSYVSDYGITLPVDDQWTLGGSSGESLPCLVHRISDDQVLNIVFIPNDLSDDIQSFTEESLEALSDNDGFILRKEILAFDAVQDIEAFYFECEMNDSEGLPYRYGYYSIDVSTGILLTISITQASQDLSYMQLAYDTMKMIELSPDLLPKPKSGMQVISEFIGKYIVYVFLAIFAIRLLTRIFKKQTNHH